MNRARRWIAAGCLAFAAYFASGSPSMVTSGNTPMITAARADEKPADKDQKPAEKKDDKCPDPKTVKSGDTVPPDCF
jgi:hypothetical protein